MNFRKQLQNLSKKRKFIISWEEDKEICEDKEELSEDDIAELADTDIYGYDWF